MTDKEAMQQALDALEIEQGAHAYLQLGRAEHIEEAITALRSRLEQPEDEPVAWAKQTEKKLRITHMDMTGEEGWQPLVYGDTRPQPAAWVGLTDEEITNLHHEIKAKLMGSYKTVDLYRAIEAKLKEKNSGL